MTGHARRSDRRPRRPPCRRPRRLRGWRGRRPRRASRAGGRRATAIVPPRRPPLPRTTKPSARRLDVGAEAAQAVDDGGDPVGLLDAQLLRAAHDGLALGEAAEQRDQRQLVDRQRHLVRARPRCRPAGRTATSSSQTGSSGTISPGRGGSRSPTTTAPIRSAMRTKPVRVQFALMSVITIREPRTRIAAAMWKAADDGSPGTCSEPSSSSSCWVTRDAVAVAPDVARRRGRAGARCGRGSARARSPSSRPSASRPASSTHDFTCARRDRQRVLDPAQRAAVHRERRRSDPRARRSARPSRAAGRRRGRRGGGGSTRRRRASTRRRAGRRASRAAAASACRRCRRRCRRPRASRSPGPRIVSVPGAPSSTSAPHARTALSDERVSAASR